jgi:predicted AAA+ superfamily ATPase
LRKRLVKSPRLYIRDAGLLHALLGLGPRENLLDRPRAGASWEGFVIEQILLAAFQKRLWFEASFELARCPRS